jgi:HK97 family phage major capsid protein
MTLSKELDERGKNLLSRMIEIKAAGSPQHHIDAIWLDYRAWEKEVKQFKAGQTLEKKSFDISQRSEEFARKMAGHGDAFSADQFGEFSAKVANQDTATRAKSAPMLNSLQTKALWNAARSRQTFRLDTSLDLKSPFTESGFASGGLPAILQPGLQLDLPYEPDRMFAHLTQTPFTGGASVEYLQHTANTNPAQPVAELGEKPDLGMQYTTVITGFTKIAAIASASMEALQDYTSFASWIPAELQRAVIDAETSQIVNGDGSGDNMKGLLHTSGVLTRAMGSDTPIDAVRKGINDIRVGASFARANLVAMHPTTWADLTLQKGSTGAYLLNPDDPSALGGVKDIFGVQVIESTAIAAGTAIVMDTSTILAWTRMGLTIDVNSVGTDPSGTNLWVQNAVSFRCEERIALGVTRPTSVCVVTGLPS